MNAYEFLRRLKDEAPQVPLGGFTSRLNDVVRGLWESYRWPYYVTSVAMSATHEFVDLQAAWDPGTETQYITDSDAGGLFEERHVGLPMTVDGESYTILSVVSSDVVTIDAELAIASGLEGSVARVRFNLPANFGRMYGRPYMASGYYSVWEHSMLEDPRHYRLEGPTAAGVYSLALWVVLSETYTVPYLRVPTAVTGPGSAVDVDGDMEKVVYAGLLKHFLRRVRAGSEIELAQLQQQVREADLAYEQGLRALRGMQAGRDENVGRNARGGGFSL